MADEQKKEVILTGVRELDDRLGGGLPWGSLGIIEGHSDAGKSVLSQHLTYGALGLQSSVAYYTTENSIRSMIAQMDSLNMGTLDYFLNDRLRIYPMNLAGKLTNTNNLYGVLTEHFAKLPRSFKLIVVDSITLMITHSDIISIVDFFSTCKNLCEEERSILLVAHSYAFDQDILSRIGSLCDVHLKLKLEQVGDHLVKVLEVLKVRGAERPTGEVVSFDIEPKIGIRIVPVGKARV